MTMLYLPFAFWMEYFLRMEKKDVGNIYFTSHDQFKEKKLHEHVLIIVLSQASTVKESSPTCLLDLVKTTIYLSPNQAMAALANERQQDSPLIRHHEMMELPQLHAQSNSCNGIKRGIVSSYTHGPNTVANTHVRKGQVPNEHRHSKPKETPTRIHKSLKRRDAPLAFQAEPFLE
ncbi:hypothetical protein NC653_033304 [Populus alba x Populus x berolinensis]|uniref:Uncharacterized protein n=1 Tax=Populus alba x Populus x berolinensis TaxID=444605 RepID=A0AAD6LTA7_9ROSI|nr:hypothetical protein NC653_033304 [Populus alba x Populus x berolinensis]